MIDVNNLAVTPGSINPGNAKRITFTWDGDVNKLTENPVEIKMSIEDGADVSFLDINDNLAKAVYWQTDFDINTTQFTEVLFLKNTAPAFTGNRALITITATNASGKSASNSCTILF